MRLADSLAILSHQGWMKSVLANDVAGNAKQTVGRATGSASLEAEGLAQEAKGEAQKAAGSIKRSV